MNTHTHTHTHTHRKHSNNKLKLVLLILLLFNFYYQYAQFDMLNELGCGTSNEELFNFLDNIRSGRDTNLDTYDFALSESYVLKVHFWEITDLDESSPYPWHDDYHMNELNAMNAVADLNFNYNKFNIYFKYDGISTFEKDDFYYLYQGDAVAFKDYIFEENDYYVEGAINVYLPKKVRYNGKPLPNGAGFYLHDNDINIVVCRLGWINQYEQYPLEPKTNNLLKHEIGHSLGLAHTFSAYTGEQVTRNPIHREYNANIAGDRVVDTNATRKMEHTVTGVFFYDFETCEYLGGQIVNHDGDINDNEILDINEVWTYTGQYRVSLTDIETNGHDTGFIENKLQVIGINPNEEVEKIQTSLYTPIVEFVDNDDLSIVIQTDVNDSLGIGDTFIYNILIKNLSNENITNISLVNSLGENIVELIGDVNNDSILNFDEIWNFSSTYQLTASDFNEELGTIFSDINIEISYVNENGTSKAYNVTKTIKNVLPTNNLTVTYQNDVFNVDQEGNIIFYTISVANNGLEPMSDIVVNDILTGSAFKQYFYMNEQEQIVVIRTPLSLGSSDIYNIMSYNTACKNDFTFGQGYRMRNNIQETLDDTTTSKLINIGIEALYEPFAGTYYFQGPNNPSNKVLFQRGFDYEFVNCKDNIYNQPSDFDETFTYGNTVYSHNKSERIGSITHLNHTAIVISQIDDMPHKCYSNFNRTALNGSIIKFIDGVPNTNVIITPKDSLNINNPSLIPNLNTGLYLIKKNYNDGSTEENLIFKED